MLASPKSVKAIYAVRYSTVAFSLAVLFWKTQKDVQQNTLAIYLALLAVLMILGQSATANNSRVLDESKRMPLGAFDLFLIYLASLVVIFSRSLGGVQIPNTVILGAMVVALCSGCYGLISSYRRRALR